MQRLARLRVVLALVAASGAAASCKSMDIGDYRDHYYAGDYETADLALNSVIGAQVSVADADWADADDQPAKLRPDVGDVYLHLLEKAMLRLAQGRPDCASLYLAEAEKHFSEKRIGNEYGDSVKGALQGAVSGLAGGVTNTLTGTMSLLSGLSRGKVPESEYNGFDYEHLMNLGMLAVCDLLTREGDHVAYGYMMTELQEEIINSTYGVESGDVDYKPRETYQRIPLAPYLQGILAERERAAGDDRISYEAALQWKPDSPLLQEAFERTTEAAVRYAPEGEGVVHVFYLAGRSPQLVSRDFSQDTVEATIYAAALSALVSLLDDDVDIQDLVNYPVKVPEVQPLDPSVPPLRIRVDGQQVAATETLLDVNVVADEQIEANLPMIAAEAVVNRYVREKLIEDDTVKLVLKIAERADTRSWTSLPAQVQVARFTAPIGEHVLDLGGGMTARVQVKPPRKETMVVVLQPNLTRPGTVLVDRWSRMDAPEPVVAAEPVP